MRPPSIPPAATIVFLMITFVLHPPSLTVHAQNAGSAASNAAADANWVQDSGTTSVTAYNHILAYAPQLYSVFVPESHASCVARLSPRGKSQIDITRECCISNLTYIGTSDILASEICCRLIRQIPQFRTSVFGDPTPACVTETCAFDAYIEAIVVRFQQKYVDEALPEAMLQANLIFNALTSLDGVLAAKLQEVSRNSHAKHHPPPATTNYEVISHIFNRIVTFNMAGVASSSGLK